MIIKTLEVGSFLSNCFLVVDETTRRAAVIDPGADAGKIIAAVEEAGVEPDCVLLTHGHLDHVGAARQVSERFDLPVRLHPADRRWLYAAPFAAPLFGIRPRRIKVDRELEPGRTIRIGELGLEVIHAPGHSRGSVVFLADGALFAGDLLFADSVGRTDLPGGSYRTLLESLRRVVLPLSDDTRVYPGHGPTTTVGRERTGNPFLAEARKTVS